LNGKLLSLAAVSFRLLTACYGDEDDATDKPDDTTDGPIEDTDEPTDDTDDMDDTNEPTDDTDDTDDTGATVCSRYTLDTATVPDPDILINAFSLYALFGFDQATSTISSITDTTDPANPDTLCPSFVFSFFGFDPATGATDEVNACTVVVYLETGVLAPWATGDVYYAVNIEPVDVDDNCDGKVFGLDLDGIVDTIRAEPIGVGIGRVSPSMLDIFEYEGLDYDEDDYLGGYYQVAYLFDPPRFSDAFGSAFEMNENLETVTTPDDDNDGLDELVVVTPAEVAANAPDIPTAAYETQSFYFYYF
jgi:hypothetical protein